MKTFIRSVKEINNSNIIMYTTEDGLTKIEVTFDGDTVWLSLDQMAKLFQRDKSTISRHIKNIFSEGEFYLKIYVYGLTFLFLYNVCTGIFTALGDSRTPLYFLIGSSLGNIFLDFWFVAGLGLGDLYCSGDFRCTGTCDAEVPAYEDFL